MLLLLIVPIIGLWIADKASDRERDAANQEVIDRYLWKAESLEDGIRSLRDTKVLRVTDDEVYIEMKYGQGFRYPYHKRTIEEPNSN